MIAPGLCLLGLAYPSGLNFAGPRVLDPTWFLDRIGVRSGSDVEQMVFDEHVIATGQSQTPDPALAILGSECLVRVLACTYLGDTSQDELVPVPLGFLHATSAVVAY